MSNFHCETIGVQLYVELVSTENFCIKYHNANRKIAARNCNSFSHHVTFIQN